LARSVLGLDELVTMQTTGGREPFATEIGDVDYAKMAEAAGLKGIRVEDPTAHGERRWPRMVYSNDHTPRDVT
jgi:hypothetical protein